jgi:hypothetical protein
MEPYEFSIVRFVPDPIREERLNIGIAVLTRDGIAAKMLASGQASRLRRLTDRRDFRFLGEQEGSLNSARVPKQLSIGGGEDVWTSDMLRNAVDEWGGMVQFTSLRGGLTPSLDGLLDSLFSRYVTVPLRVTRSEPGRARLRSLAGRTLRSAFVNQFPRRNPAKYVRRDALVSGQLERHQFDYVLGNGSPLHLVQAFSFNVASGTSLKTELDAAAWAITDVTRRKKTPVTVITSGSRQHELLRIAKGVFPALGADLIPEDGLSEWSEDFVKVVGRLKRRRAL